MIYFWMLLFIVFQYVDMVLSAYLLATEGVIELNPLFLSGVLSFEQLCALKIALCAALLIYVFYVQKHGRAERMEPYIAFMAGLSAMPVLLNLIIWNLSR